jgi:hypothetical protein
MKNSDVEIGAVYRYTYGGPAAGAMNRHGPWLVGTVTDKLTTGRLVIVPVNGLPVARTRPPAGAHLATIPASDQVHVTRLDGRLCHSSNFDAWLETYVRQEREAAETRAINAVLERNATVGMVAALTALGYDVGVGPWDRSTRWGQVVDDLRRKEPDVLRLFASALESYAGVEVVAAGSPARKAAEAWLVATIKDKEKNDE